TGPSLGNYFAIVDGAWSGSGAYTLTISGQIAAGEACDAADAYFVCTTGYACTAGTCQPAACNDGLDNDGDTRIDDFDPGCADISDGDETDPVPLPECGNGA